MDLGEVREKVSFLLVPLVEPLEWLLSTVPRPGDLNVTSMHDP
jgi:hypothetical protein